MKLKGGGHMDIFDVMSMAVIPALVIWNILKGND